LSPAAKYDVADTDDIDLTIIPGNSTTKNIIKAELQPLVQNNINFTIEGASVTPATSTTPKHIKIDPTTFAIAAPVGDAASGRQYLLLHPEGFGEANVDKLYTFGKIKG